MYITVFILAAVKDLPFDLRVRARVTISEGVTAAAIQLTTIAVIPLDDRDVAIGGTADVPVVPGDAVGGPPGVVLDVTSIRCTITNEPSTGSGELP